MRSENSEPCYHAVESYLVDTGETKRGLPIKLMLWRCRNCHEPFITARSAIEAIEAIKFPDGIVGNHQPSKWRNAAIEMAQEKIGDLLSPPEPAREEKP